MAGIPDRPSLEGLEAKWDEAWEDGGVFRFDRSKPDIYSIDTPPPTVSGQLHLGTVFGYVQFDAVARFHRMRGREVLFPIGWDDNGLPTERRVQNLYGVRCDPALPYAADFDIEPVADQRPAAQRSREQLPISRRNFVELCQRQTAIDEQLFESVFRTIGLSVDWSLMYTTVGDRCRAVAQRRIPAQPGPGRGLRGGRAHPVGCRLPDRHCAGGTGGPPGAGNRRPAWLFPAVRREGRDRDHSAGIAARLRGTWSCIPMTTGTARWSGRRSGRHCSACRFRCWLIRWPSRRRVPAPQWCAPSATPPTCCGGVNCGCRCGR